MANVKEKEPKYIEVCDVDMSTVDPIFHKWYQDLYDATVNFANNYEKAGPTYHFLNEEKDAGFTFHIDDEMWDETHGVKFPNGKDPNVKAMQGCLRFNFDAQKSDQPNNHYYEFSICGPMLHIYNPEDLSKGYWIEPIESWLKYTQASARYNRLKELGYFDKWNSKLEIATQAFALDMLKSAID